MPKIANSASRRAFLEAIRDRLAAELDGDAGHRGSCACRCGVPPDARTIPTLAKELREIVRELDDLPEISGESVIDELAQGRRTRQEQAARQADTTGTKRAPVRNVSRS